MKETSTELPVYWKNSKERIHAGTLAEGSCYLALRRTSHFLAREGDHLESKNGPPESRKLATERERKKKKGEERKSALLRLGVRNHISRASIGPAQDAPGILRITFLKNLAVNSGRSDD